MGEILELVVEFLLSVAGDVVVAMLEIWVGDLDWPDTRGAGIFWCVVIMLLGVLIWWELR